MIDPCLAFGALPASLRKELFAEYTAIVGNFTEGRWSPAELSGGRFSEVVYSLLDGYTKGTYPATASKPTNFVQACRQLEQNANGPRSFQTLIPRILPALYEIRNNRGVGHVGGDVDPNHMDATAVVGMASWVMAELVRVFHNTDTATARAAADALVERRVPAVWTGVSVRRVLDTKATLRESVVLLLGSQASPVRVADLSEWTEVTDQRYLLRILRQMHSARLIDLSADQSAAQLLPPGNTMLQELTQKYRPI